MKPSFHPQPRNDTPLARKVTRLRGMKRVVAIRLLQPHLYMKAGRTFAELKNELGLLRIALLIATPALQMRGDQSVSLAWDASPSTDVAGYAVHYGVASKAYANSLDVGDTTTAMVHGLSEGNTYYFAVTAYDAWGLSSVPSEEVRFEVPITILQTGPRVQVTAGSQPGVAVKIRFPGSPNRTYEIEATDDFRLWTTIWYSSPVSTLRWLEFSDTDTVESGVRFYRLVVH